MALPSSGNPISLDQMHVEIGGSSGSEVSINDSDIRGLISKTASTNMSFSEWRQQVLLIHSLEMIARGESVGDIAHALGYSTPSNFIAMFRRVYGDSPTRYFSNRGI